MTRTESHYKWIKEHPKAAKLIARRAYLKHRKIRISDSRKWTQANPECMALCDAKRRCYNPKNASYSYYGAKGIQVKVKSTAELIKAIGKRPSKEYSLDRINTLGHYEIGNLRWATRSQQQRNKGDKYVK